MQLTFSQKQQVRLQATISFGFRMSLYFLFQTYCHYHGKYFHTLFLMYDTEDKKIIIMLHDLINIITIGLNRLMQHDSMSNSLDISLLFK